MNLLQKCSLAVLGFVFLQGWASEAYYAWGQPVFTDGRMQPR